MSLRGLRLGALLVPAALLLHEGVYAPTGGAERAAHGYLEVALPLLVVLAASALLASLLLPALGFRSGGARRPQAPLLIAAALASVFTVQELTEALLLGGGSTALASALASAWLLAPLALLLGALVTTGLHWLERTEALLHAPGRPPTAAPAAVSTVAARATAEVPAPASPLAFGLARRPPPPRRVVH